MGIPRIVWLLWLQGWHRAPEVAQASLRSWRRMNPGWQIHNLTSETLSSFLSESTIKHMKIGTIPFEASSDLIRLELLHRYGGVWADATTMCAQSLDQWLPQAMTSGFFAFGRPVPDRLLATWFLAAEVGSYVVESWRTAAQTYWQGRTDSEDYFWMHRLFAHCYQTDPQFRTAWDLTPKHSANHKYHFGPNSPSLLAPAPESYLNDAVSQEPVIKLTHKLPPFDDKSLMATLCRFGRGDESRQCSSSTVPQRRIMVGWYGSFEGHGTIGDLRSLEVVTSHLVGAGHEVLHATAMNLDVPGAQRVDWQRVNPSEIDAALFVCGPILRAHPWTQGFFARFSSTRRAGVAVSLLPTDDPNYSNPFDVVFARQGGPSKYEDVAVIAPRAVNRSNNPSRRERVIGVSLRGAQSEYGDHRCLWRETENAVAGIISAAAERGPTRVITIENHLARAGHPAEAIEELYADCDLIITSRFHGGIMAMRQKIPFIAIDQIAGGAKVYPLLAELGWPYVYKISEVSSSTLRNSALSLLENPERERLTTAYCHAVKGANRTLRDLDAWISSLPRRTPKSKRIVEVIRGWLNVA